VDQFWENLDVNESGLVEFVEFLSAAINLEKVITKKRVKAAFKLFDLVY
jgi:calcium-dependent protein kinase